MDPSSVNISSVQLIDDILLELECPVSFNLMDSAVALSCMHNFHKQVAIDLCGQDGDNPKVGAKCPLCSRSIKYWKQNFAIEGLVPKIERLQKKLMTEQIEINRLKKAEEFLLVENVKMATMQKFHKEMFNPQISQEINVNMEKREIKIGLTVGLPNFSSIMQCFSDPRQHEHDLWNT